MFEYLLIAIIFAVSSSVGSFVNVVIDRVPQGKSIIAPGSKCDGCKKTLSWYENIPIISYLYLRGKCSTCKHTIPIRVFAVELLLGFIGVAYYLTLSGTYSPFDIVTLFLITAVLVGLFFIDAERGLLPDKLLAVLAFLISVFHISLGTPFLISYVAVGLLLFLLFLAVYLVTRGSGIGFGDVKLSFLIGYFLGFPDALLSLYIAFLGGAVVAIMLVLLGRKKLRGDTIAFGPFLIIGMLSVFFYAEEIYLALFQFASL